MKKTIREKIREYLLGLKEKGSLKPGDLIPSFHTLRKEFKTSYVTVQNAIESMAKEGLVERRQGVGTFLSSAEPLTVEIGLCLSSFPRKEMESLLAEICRQHNLYLELKLKDRCEYINGPVAVSGRKAIVTQMKFFDNPLIGNLLDFSGFQDSGRVLEAFKDLPVINRNVFLPFAIFPSQMAINKRIFKQIGFSEKLPDGFSWWDDFVSICRSKNVHPASKICPRHALWTLEKQLPLLYALSLNETKDISTIDRPPLFDTASGRRFLNMLKSFTTSRNIESLNPSFEKGNVAMSFCIGSWLTVQHEKCFGLAAEDFAIIPYWKGNRKICNMELSGLMTFISSDVTTDEKIRIWELLKVLVSKEFQIKLAEISGMLSVRTDIMPEEHPWNTRPDYAAFFPAENDIKIYNNIYNMQVIAALSALCEQFEDYGADISQIVNNMDEKIRSIHDPT